MRKTISLIVGVMLLTLGAISANPAAAEPSYYLPYPAGKAYKITQGPGGSYSHNKTSTRHAVDFEMAEKTTVVASAAGTVRYASDLGDGFGIAVWLDHGGDICTMYAHLSSTSVSVGAPVERGQTLGLSGKTGYADGAHLHWGKTRCSSYTSLAISTVETGSTFTVGSSPVSQNTAVTSLSIYANHIVKWRDQQPSPTTSWYVTRDLKRLWIPDGGTYNCLRSRGAEGPDLLAASTLDNLPDQQGKWAGCGDRMTHNRTLRAGMTLTSSDGRYRFVHQTDGNLVLYGPSGRALWATSWKTGGWRDCRYAIFQSDGNLVCYRDNGSPVWASGTNGRGGDRLIVQNDGNVVIYAGSRALWATNTNGKT